MRKIILFLYLSIPVSIYAQDYKIETVGTIKGKKDLSDVIFFDHQFVGIENIARAKFGLTTTLDKMKFSCRLSSYDEKLNPLKENLLDDGKETFGPFSSILKKIGDHVFFIYYKYDSKTGIELFSARIDPANLVPEDIKKVMTIDQKNIGLLKIIDMYKSYSLEIEPSPDRSKVLFFWTSGISNTYTYAITDNHMNVLRSASHELDDIKEFALNNVMIDNAGNFFAGWQYTKKSIIYPYLLAGNTNDMIRSIPVTLEGTLAHDVYVVPGKTDNGINICGTTTKDGDYIVGAYLQNIDKTMLKASNTIIKEVPEELVKKFEKDGLAETRKKNYGLLPDVQFDHYIMPGGNFILAGDLLNWHEAGASRTRVNVKASSLILQFTQAGGISINRLPKKEIPGDDRDNSFFGHQWGEKLIMLYIDLESNVNKPLAEAECESYASRKGVVLVAAVIEPDGTIMRRIINPTTDGSFYFSAGSTTSVDDHTLLLGLEKAKIGFMSAKVTNAYYLLTISDD